MWIKAMHPFEETCLEEFYLAEFKVCRVQTLVNEDGMFRGFVYFPGYNPSTLLPVSLKDKDLDVLKLKCLLKARDLGWNITYLY